MKNNIRKNFLWNVVGSVVNSSTSLLFLIIATRINGVEKAGIFTFAFSTACLLQVIGIYCGRAYQVTESNDNITNNDYIYSRYFTCLIMLLCSFLFTCVKGYVIYKAIIIILLTIFKMIEAFSESIYAIIQKNDDLYKVGISLFLKALLGTILFFIVDKLTKNLILSIISLIFVNLLILIFYDLKNSKKYQKQKNRYNHKNVLFIFKHGFYTFVFTFLIQYVINASKYAIDNNMSDNYQTIFGIILMPATLIILFGQFMIHPFLVTLTNNLKENKIKDFSKITLRLCFCVFIFGILADVVAHFIGIPFLEFIYGIELTDYLKPLIIIISGATLFGLSYILSNSLIVMRKTFIQTVIYLSATIFIYLLSNKLVKLNGIFGASLSYFLTMLLIFIMYIVVYLIILIKKIKEINHE